MTNYTKMCNKVDDINEFKKIGKNCNSCFFDNEQLNIDKNDRIHTQ